MKLLIAVEMRFYKTPDGSIWTAGVNDYNFWLRYLKVYESVFVIARILDTNHNDPKWIKTSGKDVAFISLPYYVGPWEYLRKLPKLKKEIVNAVSNCDCAILRVPGTIGTLVWRELKKQSKLYVLEICGDPWESLAPGNIKSVFRSIARKLGKRYLEKQCQEAIGTAYVTKSTLQLRYPPKENSYTIHLSDVVISLGTFTTNYSSVEIDENDLLIKMNQYKVKKNDNKNQCIRILNVGGMETLYKGHEIQIQAIKRCRDLGYNVRLDFAGDGRNKTLFEKMVRKHGLNDYIGFLGMLPGSKAVTEELDKSDLFILPSLVEGLPRALIEAMARGLPCIATNVGGIPELLIEEDLIPPNDHKALADKIMEVLDDKKRMETMSSRNILTTKEYSAKTLEKRRIDFYSFLRRQVEIVEQHL